MQKDVISEFSKMLGVPVRKINVRDPNIFYRERGEIAGDSEGLTFNHAVRFSCESLKAEIRESWLYLVFELKVDLNAGAWSINAPDQISLTRKIQNSPLEFPIFASNEVLSVRATEIIHNGSFRDLLKELDLGPRESLHFYRNAAVYYARSTDAAKFLQRTNALCRFIAELAKPSHPEVRRVDLPDPFTDLKEYAQRWSLGDDSERADALENASTEDLKELIERVAPRLPSISEYLKTHSGEKDAALGSLAETVAEAKIALQQIT